MTFRKTDHHKNAIDYEVAGLMWLAAARPDGAGIVEVLDHGKGWLTEPELSTGHPTREAAEDFGRRLAHTHAAGASHLGAAPDGFVPDDGYIGRAPLPLPSEPISSWGEFYAQYRIEPYMDSLDADARAIAVKRKAWLVVVSAAVGLTVLMSAGMRDLVVHHIGVAELAQEGAAVTVTGRVAADPRISSARRWVRYSA